MAAALSRDDNGTIATCCARSSITARWTREYETRVKGTMGTASALDSSRNLIS